MNKLRLIQCGVGGFGAAWLKQYTSQSPDFELAAIVDLSPDVLAGVGVEYNLPPERRFPSLEAALDRIQADAVLTVTPPPVHLDHARLAFRKGLHLMTEKPIADTLDHAREMVRLAREARLQLVVSQQYRFRPPVQKIRELLREGVIGDFGHGHLDFYMPADFTGTFREKMEFPLLLDMVIHHFDLIRCITGRDIVRVTACSFHPSWSNFRHHAGLKMLLELEGDLPFSYSADWCAIGRPTTWNGSWRLQGSTGSLHLENDQIVLARCGKFGANPVAEPIAVPPLPRCDQHATLHAFAEAIRTGIPAETSGERNLGSFGAVIAAMESSLNRCPVAVPTS